ncbi:MAG TPA: TPM domain-containing protein [Verrucomicrobiae bacterium]|nr:TPM domain-containing protein [Verrucomicrobiae bacterium]
MKTKQIFSQLDHQRIVAAIADAEKHTSGEIRVYVSHRKVRDVHHAAVRHFLKLGMDKTKYRNAVLIFVAPESRNFAILGDEAVHAKCGQEFWERVAGGMRTLFQQSKFVDGIVHGIAAAGESLARHFPARPGDRNELPDSVIEK